MFRRVLWALWVVVTGGGTVTFFEGGVRLIKISAQPGSSAFKVKSKQVFSFSLFPTCFLSNRIFWKPSEGGWGRGRWGGGSC